VHQQGRETLCRSTAANDNGAAALCDLLNPSCFIPTKCIRQLFKQHILSCFCSPSSWKVLHKCNTMGKTLILITFSTMITKLANVQQSLCFRALSKQRTEASNLHQRLTRHISSAESGDRPAAQRKAAAAAVRAFANVWFTCEDFAASQHTPQSLDTIMCLSVAKWVHLNQGDEGLKRLFGKVKEALVPGGWFVLEPQPWRSYQQARRKQVRGFVLTQNRNSTIPLLWYSPLAYGFSHGTYY